MQRAAMILSKSRTAMVTFNNKIYALGGYIPEKNTSLSDCQIYDLKSDQ